MKKKEECCTVMDWKCTGRHDIVKAQTKYLASLTGIPGNGQTEIEDIPEGRLEDHQ